MGRKVVELSTHLYFLLLTQNVQRVVVRKVRAPL